MTDRLSGLRFDHETWAKDDNDVVELYACPQWSSESGVYLDVAEVTRLRDWLSAWLERQ
jgi:hypothetical protein